jgi:hypothetical protein
MLYGYIFEAKFRLASGLPLMIVFSIETFWFSKNQSSLTAEENQVFKLMTVYD